MTETSKVSGVYTWPSGSTYAGQWQNGRRHGLGVEARGRWIYRGEWTQGQRGRYGKREVINASTNTITANYMGTWSAGFNDGYGTETYPDGGTYVGQWQRSMRHGYGIRRSAAYHTALKQKPRSSQRNASLSSLRSVFEEDPAEKPTKDKTDTPECVDGRAGFVLRARSDAPAKRRRSLSERSLAMKRSILSNLRIKKQHSTGDIHQKVTSMTGSLRSSGSLVSCTSDDSEHQRNLHAEMGEPPEERIEPGVIETYKGEWKNDQRSGFGICDRSDGLKYVGEWLANRKNGYGITYFKDGTKEEGRYKNNVLVSSTRRKALLFVRNSRMREKIEASVEAATRASSIASQKADIASSRTQTAAERADAAETMASRAKGDCDVARITASQFDPSFIQPGVQALRRNRDPQRAMLNHISGHPNHVSFDSMLSNTSTSVGGGGPPSISALGARSTQSYQHIPMGGPNRSNNAATAPHNAILQNHLPNPQNRIADSQHQLDKYSRSFDYTLPGPSTSTHTGAGHVNDGYYEQQQQQQQLYHAAQQYGGPSSSSISGGGQQHSDRTPTALHHTISTSNAAGPEDYRINDGASTSTRLDNKSHTSGSHFQGDQASASSLDTSPRIAPLRRNRAGGGSVISLSDDHFDQYTMGKSEDGSRIRRNRPSLTRQSEVNPDALGLNRRSTLASARDRRDAGPTKSTGLGDAKEDRGSLPNLAELEGQGVKLNREDAARLASARRQEDQRLREEEELLRVNPLRYIYHPSLRAWIAKWKVPLLLAIANFFLLYILFHLLTFERSSKITTPSTTKQRPNPEL
uniref:Junctophilin n=1 Tax=Panagrolaimus superbus TaxID=310955 RepID=A0A914XT43_9BILA